MRGAHPLRPSCLILAGIIPADAGSTKLPPMQVIINKDHPRGCGEHTEMLNAINWQKGSSPRMRGALMLSQQFVVVVRIIPADAGSTN